MAGKPQYPVLRVRAVTSPHWPSELEAPWRALADQDPLATPFQTWEWQSLWWRHFGKGKHPLILVVEDESGLAGLMPLYLTRGTWRAVRPVGHGASDYLHPISRQGAEREVAAALEQWLDSQTGHDLLDLHQVRDVRALQPPGERFSQAQCLVLELPKTFDEYLATLSKSLRYDVKRLDKMVFKEGQATVVETDASNVEWAMDAFFELHKARWQRRGLPGAFVGRRIQAFHRDWAATAQRMGWLWLSTLVLEGRPVGSIYAMRFGKACYFYQAGFDPAAKALSPGTLLVAHTIRRAIAEGLEEFDFLRGDEPYKRRWKPQREHANLRTLSARTPRGEIALRWNLMGSRIEAKVRERLEGKGLRG